MTPNAEWGLDGKVAIVTGGGAVGDGIGNGRAADDDGNSFDENSHIRMLLWWQNGWT